MNKVWDALQTAIVQWFENLSADAMEFIMNAFVGGKEKYTVSFDHFTEWIGGTDSLSVIMKSFASAGFYLTLIIFFLALMKRIYAPNDAKESYGDIFFHTFIAITMIALTPQIISWAMTVGSDLFDLGVTKMTNLRDTVAEQESFFANWTKAVFNDQKPSSSIIHFILTCVLLYNFVKLCIEMAKHYATMCSLAILSPMMSGFLTSADTRAVFFSFWRMLFVEIGILILNRMWLVFVIIMMQSSPGLNFAGACFLIAFITFGVKLNDIARQLGLSSASLGASLLDSIAVTGAVMFRTMSAAVNMGGKGSVFAGSALNRPGLVGVGLAMQGKGTSAASIANAMHESGGRRVNEFFSNNNPEKSNLTSGMLKNIQGAMKNGSFQDRNAAQRQINSLNAAGKRDLYDNLTKTNLGGLNEILNKNGMTAKAYDYQADNGIGVALYKADKDGNAIGEAIATGTFSDNIKSGSASIADQYGDNKFLNLNSNSTESLNGTSVKFDEHDTLSDFGSVPETLFDMKMDNFIPAAERDKGGEISLSGYQLVGAEDGTIVQKLGSDGSYHDIGFVSKSGQEFYSGTAMQGMGASSNDQERADFTSQFYHRGETLYGSSSVVDKEGAFASLGFNNVRDVSFNEDASHIEFTYDTAGESNKKGSLDRYVDHMTTSTRGGGTFIQGNSAWGSYYYKDKKEPKVESSTPENGTSSSFTPSKPSSPNPNGSKPSGSNEPGKGNGSKPSSPRKNNKGGKKSETKIIKNIK